MRKISFITAIAALLALGAEPAWAYVGPGAGLSLLTAFWTLVVAIVSALSFLILWPLRNRLRRRKNANATAETIQGEPKLDDPIH